MYDQEIRIAMSNTVIDSDKVRRCLACSDGDHQTCYGTFCDCDCGGELV